MKKSLLVLTLMAFAFIGNAEVVEVEAGGSLTVTPYYSPAHITINQGDEVHWTFVLGTHNVTSTAGPSSFSSGDVTSPGDFSFTFNTTGTYLYECTLFDHAETQNGSITVVAVDAIEEIEEVAIAVFPNPAKDILNLVVDLNNEITNVEVIDIKGNQIMDLPWKSGNTILSLDDLSSGVYFLLIETSKGITRKRIQVQR